MGWVSERASLAAPLLSWSDATLVWPGEGFEPPLHTGDPASPSTWVDVVFDTVFADYLTVGEDEVNGVIELRIYCEPLGVADSKIRTLADSLVTAYTGQDTAGAFYFHVARAELHTIVREDGDKAPWMRGDLVIPFQRFG